MQRFPLLALLSTLVLAPLACSRPAPDGDAQIRWRAILDLKRQLATPRRPGAPDARQQYADALAAFIKRYPEHGRAAEVYEKLELEFAKQLVDQGRFEEGIHHYRAILALNPGCREAGLGLADAADRMTVSRDELAAVTKGMTHADVARLLGRPRENWSETIRKAGGDTECWYYRGADGGLASVFLARGRVFATDYSASDTRAAHPAVVK